MNSIKEKDALIIEEEYNSKTKLQLSEMENQIVDGKYII